MRLTSMIFLGWLLVLWSLQVTAIVDGTDIAEPAQEVSYAVLDGPLPIQADTYAEHPLIPTTTTTTTTITTTNAELLAMGLKPNPPRRLFDPTRIRRQTPSDVPFHCTGTQVAMCCVTIDPGSGGGGDCSSDLIQTSPGCPGGTMGLCCAVINMAGKPNGQWQGEDCSYP